jgi:aminocarboxymuconate-semialdehyde decarboxylase
MTTRRAFLRHAAATGIAFCSCGMLDGARAQGAAPRRVPVMVRGKRVKTIDVHTHCFFQEAIDLMGEDAKSVPPPVKGLKEHFIVIEERLKAMDAMGIDMEVLSINPFWYRKDRDTASKICQIHNEKLAELCAAKPDRFAAFASLSLQYPDLAVQQLETAIKKQGLKARRSAAACWARISPIRNFIRSGPRRRSWARCYSFTRRARPNSPSASKATAGYRTPSAIRSTPRLRSRT